MQCDVHIAEDATFFSTQSTKQAVEQTVVAGVL